MYEYTKSINLHKINIFLRIKKGNSKKYLNRYKIELTRVSTISSKRWYQEQTASSSGRYIAKWFYLLITKLLLSNSTWWAKERVVPSNTADTSTPRRTSSSIREVLGCSNGRTDQLTNWDGTQKVGLGSIPQKKEKELWR